MKTWLAEYSDRFEDALHRLLWRQWTLLGVAGTELPGDARAPFDPEALLLLTLESARTEPRLFDEVLDWLRKHGQWIDVQRLKNLLREDPQAPGRLVAAAAAVAGASDPSSKWKRLATPPRRRPAKPEPLFLLPGDFSSSSTFFLDGLFPRYGYGRSEIRLRGLTGPIPIRLAAALRFRLRAMFGIGIRAEALCYLISGGSGNVKEISRVAGYSTLGTMQAVRELAQSEVVQVRMKGRERIFWAESGRWEEFLEIENRVSPGRLERTPKGRTAQDAGWRAHPDPKGGETRWSRVPPVSWVDWKSYFLGMAMILRFLRRPDITRMTPYVGASELGAVFRSAEGALMSVDAPFRPSIARDQPQENAERILVSLAVAGGEPRASFKL